MLRDIKKIAILSTVPLVKYCVSLVIDYCCLYFYLFIVLALMVYLYWRLFTNRCIFMKNVLNLYDLIMILFICCVINQGDRFSYDIPYLSTVFCSFTDESRNFTRFHPTSCTFGFFMQIDYWELYRL